MRGFRNARPNGLMNYLRLKDEAELHFLDYPTVLECSTDVINEFPSGVDLTIIERGVTKDQAAKGLKNAEKSYSLC